MSERVNLTDYQVGDDTLRLMATKEVAAESGFMATVAQVAAELVEYRARDAEQAPADLRSVQLALGQLSNRMMRDDDERRFGVNCALRIVETVQRGGDVEAAVEELARNR